MGIKIKIENVKIIAASVSQLIYDEYDRGALVLVHK